MSSAPGRMPPHSARRAESQGRTVGRSISGPAPNVNSVDATRNNHSSSQDENNNARNLQNTIDDKNQQLILAVNAIRDLQKDTKKLEKDRVLLIEHAKISKQKYDKGMQRWEMLEDLLRRHLTSRNNRLNDYKAALSNCKKENARLKIDNDTFERHLVSLDKGYARALQERSSLMEAHDASMRTEPYHHYTYPINANVQAANARAPIAANNNQNQQQNDDNNANNNNSGNTYRRGPAPLSVRRDSSRRTRRSEDEDSSDYEGNLADFWRHFAQLDAGNTAVWDDLNNSPSWHQPYVPQQNAANAFHMPINSNHQVLNQEVHQLQQASSSNHPQNNEDASPYYIHRIFPLGNKDSQ